MPDTGVKIQREIDEGQTKRTPVKTGSSPLSCAWLMGYSSSVPAVSPAVSTLPPSETNRRRKN